MWRISPRKPLIHVQIIKPSLGKLPRGMVTKPILHGAPLVFCSSSYFKAVPDGGRSLCCFGLGGLRLRRIFGFVFFAKLLNGVFPDPIAEIAEGFFL